jgi:hypothetical protein
LAAGDAELAGVLATMQRKTKTYPPLFKTKRYDGLDRFWLRAGLLLGWLGPLRSGESFLYFFLQFLIFFFSIFCVMFVI